MAQAIVSVISMPIKHPDILPIEALKGALACIIDTISS
jgi:hypothetical protein